MQFHVNIFDSNKNAYFISLDFCRKEDKRYTARERVRLCHWSFGFPRETDDGDFDSEIESLNLLQCMSKNEHSNTLTLMLRLGRSDVLNHQQYVKNTRVPRFVCKFLDVRTTMGSPGYGTVKKYAISR